MRVVDANSSQSVQLTLLTYLVSPPPSQHTTSTGSIKQFVTPLNNNLPPPLFAYRPPHPTYTVLDE